MKKELEIFFTALMIYTRIPTSKGIEYKAEYHQKSIKYLPLIGILVGGISALILIGLLTVFPVSVSVILSMICSLLLTGAFHEDGLADTVDGFGGGWTKEKILQIMKDSNIGVFGAISLIVILLLKFQILVSLIDLPTKNDISTQTFIVIVLIAAHSLSRLTAIATMVTHQYARLTDKTSKVKLVTEQSLKWMSGTMIIASILGIMPLLLFKTPFVLVLILPMYLVKMISARFFNKWIGGYTGDCLGAIQQVNEIVFYLGIYLLWKFI